MNAARPTASGSGAHQIQQMPWHQDREFVLFGGAEGGRSSALHIDRVVVVEAGAAFIRLRAIAVAHIFCIFHLRLGVNYE